MLEEIRDVLIRKSQGMYDTALNVHSINPFSNCIHRFFWVALQLDDICKESNDDDHSPGSCVV